MRSRLNYRQVNVPSASRSFQFGLASAPKCPQRSHRSLGPNDGTASRRTGFEQYQRDGDSLRF